MCNLGMIRNLEESEKFSMHANIQLLILFGLSCSQQVNFYGVVFILLSSQAGRIFLTSCLQKNVLRFPVTYVILWGKIQPALNKN